VAPGRVVGVPVGVVASDTAGSTLLSATLVVSRDPSPTIQKPLSQQIAGFGPFSAPSSILSYPDRDFSFRFAADTFSEPGLNYYAVAGDNSPVPAWISFDPGSLSFSGRTPPLSSLVEPPETFAFQLVASDVTGFSATSLAFAIVVGNHELTVDDTELVLNATIGTPLSYTGLRGLVRVDGMPADGGAVPSASAQDIPSWLSLDENSWEISGSPPSDAKNTSFSVVFADATSDRANVTIQLHVSSGLFRDSLPDIEVRRGEHFVFDLKPHLWKPSYVKATEEIHPEEAWVHFDASSLTWSGDVPSSLKEPSFTISIRATSEGAGIGENRTVVVHVGAAASSSSSIVASSSAALPTATGSTSMPAGADGGTPSVNMWLLAWLLPTILFCLGTVVLISCCIRQRRKRLSRMLERKDISGLVAGSFVANPGGDEDGAESLHQLSKQFDVGSAAGPLPGKKGQASSAPNSLLSRPNENTPPLPPLPATPASAPGRLRSVHDSAPLSRESWRAGSTMLLSAARSRTSRSKSYLSDTSLYDDDQATLDLLSTSPLESAFRGEAPISGRALEVPTSSSIQHTPEMAYTGSRRKSKDASPQQNARSSPEDSAVAGLPRLARPAPSRVATERRRSWVRGTARPPSSKQPATPRKKFSSSLSTIDTLDDNWSTEPSPSVVHRPRPACTGRPPEKRPPSPPPRRHSGGPARESWARRRATWRSSRGTAAWPYGGGGGSAGRDSLGLSYEDIVARSPFHPAAGETWGTLAPRRDGGPSPSSTTGDEKNWATVHEASSPSEGCSGDGDVSEMSTPEIREGRRVVLGEVRRGRQETPRLGVGMALSRWSKGGGDGRPVVESSKGEKENKPEEEDYRVYI